MRKKLIFVLALALVLLLGSVTTVFGAESSSGYQFKVIVYSGQQGVFTKAGDGKLSSGGKVWTGTFKAGRHVEISTKDLGFSLSDDKYYVRGFRMTGHDNDETTGFQSLSFDVSEDVSYEVAYGIKGAMVAYVVQYVDEDGNALRAEDTFYGMAGDKPVVSYRYVDGYQPDAYNQAKTLSSDEGSNVFIFRYSRLGAGNNPANPDGNNPGNNPATPAAPAAPGTAANPAGTAVAAAPAANAGNDGTTTIGDNDTPLSDGPSQYADLDDGDTPLADFDDGDAGMGWLPIAIGCAVGVLALIALILFLLRRRRNAEEDA